MTKPDPPKPIEPYPSMLALQEDYLKLSEEADAIEREAAAVAGPESEELLRTLVLLRRSIRRFERRATATGAVLDENADRVLAQSVLDFWCLRQSYLERLSNRLREQIGSERAMPLLASAPRLRDSMRLAPFDESSAPQLPDEPSPFVGLNAFGTDERDWAIFFGRDEAVSELKATLADHRLVLVLGPSGSGKSSLVMAGLLPALRAGVAGWICWPPVLPGADPFAALLQSVRPPGTETATWVSKRRAAVEKSPETLVSVMAEAGASERPSLLIVDQVEELLSMVGDAQTRAAFAAAIVAPSLSKDPQHRVIVIVREDFLDRLLKLDAFANLPGSHMCQFRPKPMTSAELRLAIEEPARAIGLKFDEGIVEDLVREVVNDPAALPLLQFTLTQLWRKRRRNRITHEIYAEVGRPAEALGRTAEQVFEDLNTQQAQAAAHDIFLTLVAPSVGAEFVRLRVRRDLLHGLRDSTQIDRVLERFVAAGLIRDTPGAEKADDRFDVMHEALLRNWQRLTGWLEEKRRASESHFLTLGRARLWDQSGREKDHLAIGGAIAEAEAVADNSPLILEYVQASRAEAAAQATQRTRQRRIVLSIFGAVALVVLTVLIINGFWNRRLEVLKAELDTQRTEQEREVARLTRDGAILRSQKNDLQAQIDSALRQFNEVVAAAAPVARNDQPTTAGAAPGEWGIIWVGNRRQSMLADPRTLAEAPLGQVQPARLYRLRANVALREGFPGESDYRFADRRFRRSGIAPAGALIWALEPPKLYERPEGGQYWLRVRIVPRVLIRHPNGTDVAGIVNSLRRAGYVAAAESVPAEQSGSELRYFYVQDEGPARILARALARLVDPRHPSIAPVAMLRSALGSDPGTLELWLDPTTRLPE